MPKRQKGLRLRGRIWWIDITINGHQYQFTTRTPDYQQAKKIYHKVFTDINERRWFDVPVGADKTFKELMQKYMQEHSRYKAPKTHKRNKSLADHLISSFGDCTLLEVTPHRISAHVVSRREEGAAPKTINNELTLLGHAFNLAVKLWGWVDINPVTRVPKEKVYNQRDRYLREAEEERLLPEAPNWLRDIIIVALHTAMRQGELLDATWDQVDLARQTVYIGEQKNRGKDTIPLNIEVLQVLERRSKVRSIRSNYVFYNRLGGRINARNLIRAFHVALRKAGIENFRFHDLRHTAATRMANRGVTESNIRKFMRHRSASMTARYTHHNVEDLRDAAEVLAKKNDKKMTMVGS